MNSLLLSALAGCMAAPMAQAPAVNPKRVHDPCAIRVGDTYTVFATGRGIPYRTSTDLVRWEEAGRVFPDRLPEWIAREVPGVRDLWAPDIARYRGQYYLYYSVSTFGSQRSCIGLATNATLDPGSPDYRWVDRGKVIGSRPGVDDFNAIDPNFVLDEQGQPWLAFGSFWGGIQLVRLDPESGLRAGGNAPAETIAARPKPGAIEAPFLVRRGEFFYLFASFDFCCRGVDSTYKVAVGQSRAIAGPYLDREGRPMRDGGGTVVLAGSGNVRGPGHNAVLLQPGGDLLFHHYYDPSEGGQPRLQVRPLRWTGDGWPEVGEPLGSTPPPKEAQGP